jgi:hypothetical protein
MGWNDTKVFGRICFLIFGLLIYFFSMMESEIHYYFQTFLSISNFHVICNYRSKALAQAAHQKSLFSHTQEGFAISGSACRNGILISLSGKDSVIKGGHREEGRKHDMEFCR